MPYSDKEVEDFWASIDEAASNAPKAPYSHSKVRELIRVAWQLKSQNAKLIQQLADQQAEVERLQEENEKIKSWVAGYQVQIGSRNQELAELRAEMERLQAEVETLRGNYLREGRQRDRLQVEVDWLKKDVEFLKRTSTCKCGDGFTEDGPGTCGNCLAARYLPG